MIRLDDSKKFKEMIRKIEKKMLKAEQDIFCCSALTLTQCYILVELGQRENLSIDTLAELISIENAALSKAAADLIEKGLLEKNDLSFSLTEKGRTLFDRIEDSTDHYYANLFTHIPREKRPQVFESMMLVLDASAKSTCCGGQSNCYCTDDKA